MAFDFETLKDILVCPRSHAALVQDGESLVSTDPATRLRYAIRDDIPIMILDEATELSPEEWAAVMQKCGRDPQTGQLREQE